MLLGREAPDLAETRLCHLWESCVAKALKNSDCRQFPAVAGAVLPLDRTSLSCPIWEPHSFLSNSTAKRLGHSESDRYAPGPSPAQMSELPSLGASRVFCVLYFCNRPFTKKTSRYQAGTQERRGASPPQGTTWPRAQKNDLHKDTIYSTKSWKKAPIDSSQ